MEGPVLILLIPQVYLILMVLQLLYGVVGSRSLYLRMPGYHCTPGNNVNTADSQAFSLTASL